MYIWAAMSCVHADSTPENCIIHTNTTVEMKRRPRRQCERICTRVVQFFDFVNNLRFQFILILEIKGFMVPDFLKIFRITTSSSDFWKKIQHNNKTYGFGFMKIFKTRGCIDERTGKEPAV
jgi:hypothetical protein